MPCFRSLIAGEYTEMSGAKEGKSASVILKDLSRALLNSSRALEEVAKVSGKTSSGSLNSTDIQDDSSAEDGEYDSTNNIHGGK